MRFLLAALCMLLVTSLASVCVSASSVPLLLWSSTPYFPSHSVASVDSAVSSSESLNSVFEPILTAHSPELVIAFLLPEFSSAELSHAFGAFSEDHLSDSAYSFLKQTVLSSSSSLTYLQSLPIYSEHQLINIVQNVQPKARTLSAHCDNAINELNREKYLGSNGHTDLLVVSITSASQADECVNSVLNSASDTNYLAVLSAKQPHAIRRNFGSNVNAPLSAKASFLAQAHSAQTGFNVQANSASSSSSSSSATYSPYGPQRHPDFPKSYLAGQTYLRPGPLYINSAITLGLIVGLFMLVILLIGLSCITDIERPVRMTNTPIQIPKEY